MILVFSFGPEIKNNVLKMKFEQNQRMMLRVVQLGLFSQTQRLIMIFFVNGSRYMSVKFR
jgi:hypothetical protein